LQPNSMHGVVPVVTPGTCVCVVVAVVAFAQLPAVPCSAMLCYAACRFVEVLLQAGRPATALAVQRARCAGGSSGSSSLNEAEVLLRVQLGCGLLAEAFCDLRRHCSEVRSSIEERGRVTHHHHSTWRCRDFRGAP
jgi:hypothetical protein